MLIAGFGSIDTHTPIIIDLAEEDLIQMAPIEINGTIEVTAVALTISEIERN
ncbi:TPA: hypothetical protein QCU60_004348 [Bacillus cereus]|nr:hypothetical protein [Bacillus cereus]HDR6312360.1 hypothetical protein [Bacillus cereus]